MAVAASFRAIWLSNKMRREVTYIKNIASRLNVDPVDLGSSYCMPIEDVEQLSTFIKEKRRRGAHPEY